MQSDEGIIREFGDEIPKGWTDLTVCQIVNIKDCYFKINRVNIEFQELVLTPMKKADAVEEILKSSHAKIAGLEAYNGAPPDPRRYF